MTERARGTSTKTKGGDLGALADSAEWCRVRRRNMRGSRGYRWWDCIRNGGIEGNEICARVQRASRVFHVAALRAAGSSGCCGGIDLGNCSRGMQHGDDVLWAGVGVDNQMVVTGRNDFVGIGEQEDAGGGAAAGVLHGVDGARDRERNRAGEQPEVPPAPLAADQLRKRGRVVDEERGDGAVGGDAEGGEAAEAQRRTTMGRPLARAARAS